jgi:hypothetical protein
MDILESHVQTLHAIANRILPPEPAPFGEAESAASPGAGDNETLGIVAEVMTGELVNRLDELRMFLDKLNVASKLKHQRRFSELSPDEQDVLLRAVEDQPIFGVLADLVHEGYWASPAGQAVAGFVVSDPAEPSKDAHEAKEALQV